MCVCMRGAGAHAQSNRFPNAKVALYVFPNSVMRHEQTLI